VVDPDVTKILAAITIYYISLGSVSFDRHVDIISLRGRRLSAIFGTVSESLRTGTRKLRF
jgi:hypothetical protein